MNLKYKGTGMKQEQSKKTGIQFGMDSETNKLLERSAKASMRTKKAEAAIRLADHVRKFPSIDKLKPNKSEA